eukprot:356534-Chlamydomonas_euryale.AAC.12
MKRFVGRGGMVHARRGKATEEEETCRWWWLGEEGSALNKRAWVQGRTRRRNVHGCAFQSIDGNQLSSTRMNRQKRYICGARRWRGGVAREVSKSQ